MEEKVITISNETVDKNLCRKINNDWYKVGDINIKDSGEVYLIDDKYVRYNTGFIEYDYEQSKYVRVNSIQLIQGIVEFKNKKPIIGYFSANQNKNVFVILENLSKYICINEDLLINNLDYREMLSTGDYYHISTIKARKLNSLRVVERRYKESLPYDSRGITDEHTQKYERNYNPVISDNVRVYTEQVLKDLSFGLEFETILGQLPNKKANLLPLIPLRDGSISGLEYVTIPLQGPKGLQGVIDSVKELEKRTKFNNSCALHLHMGNIPRTKEFILASYKLFTHLQEEMFSMFPLYKKYNLGVKKKNYSKPFDYNQINAYLDPIINDKNIDKNFDVLYKHLSVGQSFYDVNCNLDNVKYHPSDPNGTAKWNINSRYFAYNYIPILFGNKQTIEFRLHTPTYDIDKIINFIFINGILLNYCKEFEKEILSKDKFLLGSNLSSIIIKYLEKCTKLNSNRRDFLIDQLLEYINKRVDITYRQSSRGDIIGNESEIKCTSYIDWNKDIVGWEVQEPAVKKYKVSRLQNGFGNDIIQQIEEARNFVAQFEQPVLVPAPPAIEIPGLEPIHDLNGLIIGWRRVVDAEIPVGINPGINFEENNEEENLPW